MTLTEFLSEENLKKTNPFDDCDVIDRVTYRDYVRMTDLAVAGLFSEQDNSYRPLSKELMIRLAVMTVMLNLTNIDEYKDVDTLFDALICRDIYDKFYNKVALKVVPNMKTVVKGINDYIKFKVELGIKGGETETKVLDTLIGLLGSESFMNLLNQIQVDDEVVSEDGEV